MHIEQLARRACGALCLVVLVAACSAPEPKPSGPELDVTVKDFDVRPAVKEIPSGRITLDVWNEGPTTHEFVVVRSALPARDLPIGEDGLSVDEDALDPLGEIEEVRDGAYEELTLDLAPGRYVLFCNLEGHYLSGMHASIEVADA